MTNILFKLGMFSLILGFITSVLAAVPTAGPLPQAIEFGVLWFLPKLYFLSPIFPVSTFYIVLTYMIDGFLIYIVLTTMKNVINKALKATGGSE